MKFKMCLLVMIVLFFGCGTAFPVFDGGFKIESISKTQNGRCVYYIECERPAISCQPMFLDECNKYKVGDTLYLTLKKENNK